MDFSQLENVIKISESSSINQASSQLYITQSALNQQLLRLENEFGVKLFQRSKAGITPTAAGSAFIEYARKILDLKSELASVMNDYSEHKIGVVKIGLPTVRGYELFTRIFPLFHEKYPYMKLEPLELSVKRQKHLLSLGEIDLAFMTLSEGDESEDIYIPIQAEEILLAVPKSDPFTSEHPEDELDLSLLEHKKFIMIYRDSTLRGFTDRLFLSAGFHPDVLLETSNHHTIANLVSNGYGCAIVPRKYFVDESSVRFYHMFGHPSWMLCAAYKKGSYLSEPQKYLLELVRGIWQS